MDVIAIVEVQQMFGCHIHLVVCSCVAIMKYIFDNMLKGNDFISVEGTIKCNVLNYDEVEWNAGLSI